MDRSRYVTKSRFNLTQECPTKLFYADQPDVYDPRSPRRINWTRVFAAVLTSKLFFLTSCTGGMVLGFSTFDGIESGVHGNQALDNRMAVIAVIPNADKPGGPKVVQTSLGSLEGFKQENPNHSFVPPLGKGELNDPLLYTRTEYAVTAAGPGKVTVETKFHDDEHHVRARYTATDKEIKPLYTKTSYGLSDLLFGFSLALVLALVGYIFEWRLRRIEGATGVLAALAV